MKLTGVTLFASVAAAAVVLKRQGDNPFAGLPDISTLGICTTECQTISQTQQNPPSNWTTTCTPTFAAGVQSCLNCISTTAPAFLFTEEVKEGVSYILAVYANNCLTLASTTESITLPTVLSPTATPTFTFATVATV